MRILDLMRNRAAQVAGAVLVLAAMALPVSQMAFAADNPDCNANAVVFCGADTNGTFSRANLITKVDNGDQGGHSAANIQAIYTGFLGLSGSALTTAITNSKDGVVTKTGDVIVGGKTVATGVWTAGRLQIGSNDQTMNGVFMRPPSVSFLSDQLSAYVIMNGNTFVGAIIESCGNPVYPVGHPFGKIYKRVVTSNGNVDADTQATAVTEDSGSTFHYLLTVDNLGNVTMDNTVVTDTLPAGITLASGKGQDVNVNLGSIPAHGNKSVDLAVKVTATSAGCINNVAKMTANDNQSDQNNAWICVPGKGGTPTPTPTVTPTPSTTPTPTPTPVCQSNQSEVNGVCVTNVTNTTSLPQTGADGLAGLAGMGGMGYAARAYLRSKKNLRDTLRRK